MPLFKIETTETHKLIYTVAAVDEKAARESFEHGIWLGPPASVDASVESIDKVYRDPVE